MILERDTIIKAKRIMEQLNNGEEHTLEQLNNGEEHTLEQSNDEFLETAGRRHALLRPNFYIGSVESIPRTVNIINTETWEQESREITVPVGLEKLFLEILSNACDNVKRSRDKGVDPEKIEIVMSDKTITITNFGLPVPVKIYSGSNKWIPEMIFGQLYTGSYYI